MITDASQTGIIVFLPAITIDTAPDKHIEIKETFAENCIGLNLAIIAGCCLRLKPIHIGTLFGDDVHHACQGYTAIERRSRTSQHFYLLHLLERDTEIRGGGIGGVAVQTVAVEH